MSGVTHATIAVAVLFGEQKVRNRSIASFQACTRQVRYTPPIAVVSLRRSEPPLRAQQPKSRQRSSRR